MPTLRRFIVAVLALGIAGFNVWIAVWGTNVLWEETFAWAAAVFGLLVVVRNLTAEHSTHRGFGYRREEGPR